jgi:predicted enzyme related to lactoylglutathione lyase
MHKSKLYLIAIDVKDLDASFDFWSKALKVTLDPSEQNDEAICRRLTIPGSGVSLFLRKVREKVHAINHVHLDIGTDDLEAERKRLENIGAKTIRYIDDFKNSYYVMEDPDRNVFCIVKPEYNEVLDNANIW